MVDIIWQRYRSGPPRCMTIERQSAQLSGIRSLELLASALSLWHDEIFAGMHTRYRGYNLQ